MGRDNKGWDYLNSNDADVYSDVDGEYIYTSSDGSGSYRGSDGSWGYKEPDGSGSFHGSDGSWGYKESDGSISYHGADGSWGYKNPDGSGAFHGKSDSVYYEKKTSSDRDVGTGLFDTVLALGTAAVLKEYEEEKKREAERKRRAQKRRKKARAWIWKYKIELLVVLLIIAIFTCLIVFCSAEQKKIPMGVSSEELIGQKHTAVVQKLKEAGFSNVRTREIADLTLSRADEEDLVTEIKLTFRKSFDEETLYPSNWKITVVYHTVELYKPPLTSFDARGKHYEEVVKAFEDVGFVNVTAEPMYDITAGLLWSDGDVDSVTINGEKGYGYTKNFRLDSEIVIRYHTLKKNR